MLIIIVSKQSFQQFLQEQGIKDIPLASNQPLLQSIASKLCEWKPLTRFLGIDESTIITIERNYRDDHAEQKFQALNTWVTQNRNNATLFSLLRVIYCDLNNRLLAEEITQIQRTSM